MEESDIRGGLYSPIQCPLSRLDFMREYSFQIIGRNWKASREKKREKMQSEKVAENPIQCIRPLVDKSNTKAI